MNFFSKNFMISPKKLLAATLLTSGTLAWFFLLNFYIYEIVVKLVPNEPLSYYNVGPIFFYGFAIFSAVIGSFIGKKISRRKLLLPWILMGILSTLILTVFQGPVFLIIASFLLGTSLGLGLPSSMAFISDCTEIGERGRVSGIIILTTFIMAFIVMAVIRSVGLGLSEILVLFAIVRSTSLIALTFEDCSPKYQSPNHVVLPKFAYKEFILYIFPWVMFIVAAGLAWGLIPTGLQYDSVRALGTNLRYVCIAIFGLIAGFSADRFGRKQPIIAALIMLGVGFALIGFNLNPTNILIYLILSGGAWGLLFVVFLAVPGDLSVPGSREKFYGIGYISPLAILFALSSIPGVTITAILPASLLSQILSFILFISIIPILRATETLPREKIQERRMKDHLEKVEELIAKNKST